MLHEREEHREGEGVLEERQPDTGDTGTAGKDESIGATGTESFTGDPQRIHGYRERFDVKRIRGNESRGDLGRQQERGNGGLRAAAGGKVAYDEESKKYQFTQEVQEEEDGYASAEDKVYGVLYETERDRSRLVMLRARSESGSTSYALPEDWDSTKVKVYCFAMLKNGKGASDSVLIS